MSDPIANFPTDLVAVDLQKGSIALTVDASLYPLSALYAAGYIFIDRCYVLLDKPDATHFRVTLSAKKGEPSEGVLSSFVGEFCNELLSCAWRAKIAEESRAIIESATAQALQGAMGPPSLDDLEKFDFSEEAFEDPLGIAMSWEEKYGKNKKKAAGEEGDGAAAAPKEQA
jgi:His-Xaa-Ser system protein HxsD